MYFREALATKFLKGQFDGMLEYSNVERFEGWKVGRVDEWKVGTLER